MYEKKLKDKFTNKGFTLVELTIVFSIIALVGSIGYASYTTFSERQTLEQAALNLKSGIDDTKISAISRVKPTGCAATSVLNGYSINICTGTSCTNMYDIAPVCPPSAPASVPKKRPTNIVASFEGQCTNPLIFSAQIGLTSGPCTITLYNTKNNAFKTVCIDAGGNVSIKNNTVTCE